MNDAATPVHVCPGIRIHIIDIVQPPGMSISPIGDIDVDIAVVNAALARNSNAETPMNVVSRLSLTRSAIVESPSSVVR
jgi:hypothetical protein